MIRLIGPLRSSCGCHESIVISLAIAVMRYKGTATRPSWNLMTRELAWSCGAGSAAGVLRYSRRALTLRNLVLHPPLGPALFRKRLLRSPPASTQGLSSLHRWARASKRGQEAASQLLNRRSSISAASPRSSPPPAHTPNTTPPRQPLKRGKQTRRGIGRALET